MPIEDLLARDFATVADLIRHHAQAQPAHVTLWQDERSVDYAALDALVDRVASALQRDRVQPQDVIAICASTSIEYAAVFLGAIRAGVTVAPLAPDTSPSNLAAMIDDAGAVLLFLDAGVAAALDNVSEQVTARVVTLDGSGGGEPVALWLAPEGAAPRPIDVKPEWAFNIIYSSGTTGTPKGIVMPFAFRWAQVKLFLPLGYGPEAVVMISIPLYSNMTLSSFLPALSLGAKLVLMGKFDAGRYLALSEAHRVTHAMMVPVQYQRIMDHPDFDRFDLRSFRMKSCGSAPFAAGLKQRVLDRWPGELVEFYGMTEGGGVCSLPARQFPDKLHTVGRPAAGHDMRVIDDAGRELPRGATGEIVGRSGTMMTGYRNLPQKTAEAEWFDAQGLRFIRTGDVGRFDDDGFLTLLDRKKDMVISGGFNVYPSDLEAVLCTHDDVSEAAVAGVPSARWGESPVAFVVLRPGRRAEPGTLLAWANARLGKAQRLAALEVVDVLPRSDIGKVLKRQVRDAFIASGRAADLP